MIGDSEGTGTGAMLGAARRARGLDLADIARDTRVPLRHLRAIEDGSHQGLPALTYALGFVKAFARAVGVDPELAAAQFRQEFHGAPAAPAPSVLAPDLERRAPSPLLVGGSVAVVVAVIAGLSAWSSGLFDPPAAAVADAAPDDALAPPPAVAVPAPVPAPAAVATGPVVLTAREEVWVRIADPAAPQSFKTGTLAAGEILTLPPDQPGLKLWTGKAGALLVSVGGRELPPLGGPIERLRGISLAAADLVARSTPAPAPVAPDASPVSEGATAAPAATGPRPIATVPRPRPPEPSPVAPTVVPPATPPAGEPAGNTTPSVPGLS